MNGLIMRVRKFSARAADLVYDLHFFLQRSVRRQLVTCLTGLVARQYGTDDGQGAVNRYDGRGRGQATRRSWKGFTVEISPSSTIR